MPNHTRTPQNSRPSPTTSKRRVDTNAGILAHRIIQQLLTTRHVPANSNIAETCLTLASTLSPPHRQSHADTIVAAGYANEYLQLAAPAAPWTATGVEHGCGCGRVDVVFTNHDGRSFYEEIKTSGFARRSLDEPWLTQARRYSAAGRASLGQNFLGTRIVPLGNRHLTCLVTPDLDIVALDPTPDNPLRERS